uniref:Uncharacterized protein n=1 Tax=Picea glauca TaxID=3330 RepID=A0A101LWA4_PICGL|nr:hypothetical protein ABT39_MTgene1646 [Picea glauca]QHR87920.1 hypothetical protein Q903MT_gene1932 [Picea sitchensis]
MLLSQSLMTPVRKPRSLERVLSTLKSLSINLVISLTSESVNKVSVQEVQERVVNGRCCLLREEIREGICT